MGWTGGTTRATGDLISAANWNSYLGATGSLEHLHDAAHMHVNLEAAGTKGTSNLTFTTVAAAAFVSGKIWVYFNGVLVVPSCTVGGIAKTYITFTPASGRWVFTADWKTDNNGSNNI